MITLYILAKNNVKKRTIIEEGYYTSINQALIQQKKDEMSVPSDYFILTRVIESDTFPVTINGTPITASTVNFLLSPFVVREYPNPAFAIETNTNNKLQTFSKSFVLGGKEFNLPFFPNTLIANTFIDSLLDLVNVTYYAENPNSYILPAAIATLDTRVQALRTEAEMLAFQTKIENFTRAIVEILRTFIFDNFTAGGTVDDVVYTTTVPKQDLIRAAIQTYITNNNPF